MTRRTGWIDATGGISGDMLLGACLDAGVPVSVIQEQLDRLDLPERIEIGAERAVRSSIGATRAIVRVSESHHHRNLDDVLGVLAGVDEEVRGRASAVFRNLAEAEARVHRVPVDEVHFHEVGALDSIADIVGVVAGLHALELDRLVCSPIGLGGGRAETEHGLIPIPGPAVVELLRTHRAPGFGGPVDTELATPTGVALVVTLAAEFGALPPLRPEVTGSGAGSKDPSGHPNLTRIIAGAPIAATDQGPLPQLGDETEPELVVEANVDDLDPRLWPQVLAELLAAGASDAWLTPILMKKGRPAHTLSVLTSPPYADQLTRIVLTHTTTIGLRRYPVGKLALAREWEDVGVYGHRVRVKLARLDGAVVNATPEYDDVARVAAEQGIPERVVLSAAMRAVADHWEAKR